MMICTTRSDSIPAGMKVKELLETNEPIVNETVKLPFGKAQITNVSLSEQGKDKSKLFLIYDMTRIGVGLFSVKFEYTYFAPRSGRNDLFNMTLLKWPTENFGLMWAILSCPIEFRPQAEALAQECGLRIANGIPHFINAQGAHSFPLDGETVFTLENINNHQVYQNDPVKQAELRKQEKDQIDIIINGDRAKLMREFEVKGYTVEQVKRILSQWELGNDSYDEAPANVKDGSHHHGSPSMQGPA